MHFLIWLQKGGHFHSPHLVNSAVCGMGAQRKWDYVP